MYHMEKESNPAIVNDCVQLMNGLIKILFANIPDLFEFVILKKAMSSCLLSLWDAFITSSRNQEPLEIPLKPQSEERLEVRVWSIPSNH